MKARVAVFVKPDAPATELGIIEFNVAPAEGDTVALPNHPLLKVIWRKFTPTSAEHDIILGCSYFALDQAEVDSPVAVGQSPMDPRTINEVMQSNKSLIIDIQSRAFDKASAYTNVIIAAGYAAIFAIWSNAKSSMSVSENSSVSFLLMFSFSVFVIFEVTKMIVTSMTFRRNALAAARDPEKNDYLANMIAAEQASQAKMANFIRYWPLSLFLSIIPAILVAGFLFYKFASLIVSGK